MILYHYCSPNAFYQIMTSGELWLTSYRYFNDYSERQHYIDLVHDVMLELNPDIQTATQNDILSQLNHDGLEYYVCCFSEKQNSLSQWRGYADDGKGYCIGFDFSPCDIHDINHESLNTDVNYCMGKIQYDNDVARDNIRDLLLTYIESEDEGGQMSVEDLVYIMSRYAIFDKDASFVEEAEHRIVNISNGAFDWKSLNGKIRSTRFVTLRDYIVPYRAIPLKKGSLVPVPGIREIWLGPKVKFTVGDIQDFLISCPIDRFGIEVNQSRITYR